MNIESDNQTKNLSEYAYKKIEHAIVSAKLDFGEPLSENALATGLNISKAPVRTALLELKRKGLVDIVPQSGCYVTIPTAAQVKQITEIRVMLETNSLKIGLKNNKDKLVNGLEECWQNFIHAFHADEWLKALEHDISFHATIIQHSCNDYIIDSYHNVLPMVQAMMHRFLSYESKLKNVIEEQEAIIFNLKEDNLSMANRLLRKHIQNNRSLKNRLEFPDRRASRKEYSHRNFEAIFAD